MKISPKIYNEIIDNMFAEIEQKYGSVKKFCEKEKISRFNLSKIKNRKQMISILLFNRICKILFDEKALPTESNTKGVNISLADYINIDKELVNSYIFQLITN